MQQNMFYILLGSSHLTLQKKSACLFFNFLCTSVIHFIPKGIFKLFARKEICFLLFKFRIHYFFFCSYFYLIIMHKTWIVSNYLVYIPYIEIVSLNYKVMWDLQSCLAWKIDSNNIYLTFFNDIILLMFE